MANMTDEEFIEIYGRPPVRVKRRRYKVYWGRVIIALIILILLICGSVQLIKGIIGLFTKKPQEDKKLPASANSGVVSNAEAPDDGSNEEDTAKQLQFKVCIDAGHGDYDGGTASNDGTRLEKDDNLRIALAVAKYLEDRGVTVVMTRSDDTFVELQERCDLANQQKADLFVSLHRNSYDGEMNGVEIWVHNSEPQYDTVLARNIIERLDRVGIADNRGVRYGYVDSPDDNYYVNADTLMPSCLVELGFVTDDGDNALFDANFDGYVKAIGDGVIETAKELKVIDSDGSRILNEMLLSDGKYFRDTDDTSSGEDTTSLQV